MEETLAQAIGFDQLAPGLLQRRRDLALGEIPEIERASLTRSITPSLYSSEDEKTILPILVDQPIKGLDASCDKFLKDIIDRRAGSEKTLPARP